MIRLLPLLDSDREQFVRDNQEAFRYGAMEEFGLRDSHFEEPGEIISRATILKSMDNPQSNDIRFSVQSMPSGRRVVVLDRTEEIAKINLNDPKSLHDYLLGKVGQQLLDGFFVGDELPDEYIFSKDAKGNNKRKRKAKAKLASSLDEAALSASKPVAEAAEHKKREDGKYYRRAFAFAVPSRLPDGFRAYTADLVSYMKGGAERLYDVVNIEDAPDISADLAQSPSRIAQTGTSRIPAESRATPRILPQSAPARQEGAADAQCFSVTPAEDAAYLDAVSRGDMETAQRMVREAAARSSPARSTSSSTTTSRRAAR